MSSALINFSGHALSDEAMTELKKEYTTIINLPPYNIDFSGNVEQQLITIVKSIDLPLDGSLPITIIPPGHSTYALLLSIFLEGLIGYFPNICLLEPVSGGLFLPSNRFFFDGYKIRQTARKIRQEFWSISKN